LGKENEVQGVAGGINLIIDRFSKSDGVEMPILTSPVTNQQ
jgi:hypothetical protein